MDQDSEKKLGFWRHDTHVLVVYSLCYSLVFLAGLLGNTFVVLAVVLHRQLRTTTDYLISSLAIADLLIIIFCLPTTLLNNILTEWQLGDFICKMSVWINSTTSCASIYTLVAVTADRYLAICHTLKYTLWESSYTFYVIAGIWLVSGSLATPSSYNYNEVQFNLSMGDNATVPYTVCITVVDQKLHFVLVNLLLAFLVPFFIISISYILIFYRVYTHRSLAVDAHARDERVKLRVAHMMFTVIVVFAVCWIPLYGIYCYFTFLADNESSLFAFASSMLRPFFQWLSLLSSSLNPLIYIAYSHKYRTAFHRLLLSPCRKRYHRLRALTKWSGGKKDMEGTEEQTLKEQRHHHIEKSSSWNEKTTVTHYTK